MSLSTEQRQKIIRELAGRIAVLKRSLNRAVESRDGQARERAEIGLRDSLERLRTVMSSPYSDIESGKDGELRAPESTLAVQATVPNVVEFHKADKVLTDIEQIGAAVDTIIPIVLPPDKEVHLSPMHPVHVLRHEAFVDDPKLGPDPNAWRTFQRRFEGLLSGD